MPKSTNQKNKLLYILKYLEQFTDEDHSVTMAQIIEHLERQGIDAERKSVYNDIEVLRNSGYDIIGQRHNRQFYYYLPEREFELSEIKILVDAVNSFKFTTESSSRKIVKKLSNFTSRYQAASLQRDTHVADRVKSRNKTILYNIDAIHQAIQSNSQISFKYFSWNENKGKTYRHNGADYILSPWQLLLSDGNYYLLAYDMTSDAIRHYRVDKMETVQLTGEKRKGEEKFKARNIEEYTSGVFSMFGGDFEYVDLMFENDIANVVIDRFGQDIIISNIDDKHFKITVKVVPTNQFFGWMFGLGDKAKIVGPEKIKDQYIKTLNNVLKQY